jgi:hypothetical protein
MRCRNSSLPLIGFDFLETQGKLDDHTFLLLGEYSLTKLRQYQFLNAFPLYNNGNLI